MCVRVCKVSIMIPHQMLLRTKDALKLVADVVKKPKNKKREASHVFALSNAIDTVIAAVQLSYQFVLPLSLAT